MTTGKNGPIFELTDAIKKASSMRRSPLPSFQGSERWRVTHAKYQLTDYEVKEYFAQHPKVFETFVMETVTEDVLEDLLLRKRKQTREVEEQAKYNRAKLSVKYEDLSVKTLAIQIVTSMNDLDIYENLYTMASVMACAINADGFTVYAVLNNCNDLSIYLGDKNRTLKPYGIIAVNHTVAAHVAATREGVNVHDVSQDARFPKSVGIGVTDVSGVIGLPIELPTSDLIAVVEFTRGNNKDSFSVNDFKLCKATFSWVTACIHKMKLNKVLLAQQKLNDFLLETTKVMFDDIDNIDSLVTNIMMYAKNLVGADRCALFLVDEERKELYADYFDEGKTADGGVPLFTKSSQIRFPQNRGIAGYVANTGERVNIKDAYSDPRFNPDVDKKTGYHTKNILCMPIVSKNKVIGVVQMVNSKTGEAFTNSDEETFKMFAVYCALALHYSRIYNLLAHQQTKYKVAMEVLDFHINIKEEDALALADTLPLDDKQVPKYLNRYDFCCYEYDDILPHLFVHMMLKMFGDNSLEIKRLCRFTLTVRKNYRPVSYHNWQHGFHVAHALWVILRTNPGIFTTTEQLSLIVAGICHDVDHRGYNNEFFKKLSHPLAALYSTSVMEQHHYKQTITILHTEGNDIFSHLTADEHKRILDLIRQHIIATDLALYFNNQKNLSKWLEEKTFDIGDPVMRDATMALMMTGADLCAIAKPWQYQMETVQMLYQEFYAQGDEEKKLGLTPIPMLDRETREHIPKQQIGFINFICVPMYSTLKDILPGTKHLLTGTQRAKENWELMIKEFEQRRDTISFQ